MRRREAQHLAVHVAIRQQRAKHAQLLEQDRPVRQRDVVHTQRERHDRAARLHQSHVRRPLGLRARAHKKSVERRNALECRVRLGRDELTRAELLRLRLLAVGARKDDDCCAESREELDRQVAEAANAKHTDTRVGTDARIHDRAVHGRASALQRRRMRELDLRRDDVHKLGVNHDSIAETAETRLLKAVDTALGALLVIALKTLVAVVA